MRARSRDTIKTALVSLALVSAIAAAQNSGTPQDAVLREMRVGQSALQQHDFKEAKRAFERAAKLDPAFADAYLGLGLADLRSGEIADAIAALKKTTELNPQLTGPHLFLGIAEYQAGNAEAAVNSLRAELMLAPDNLEALRWLGIVELGRGHPEEAAAALDRAAMLSHENPEVLYYRARAHKEVAKVSLQHLYDLDSDSVLVHRALGESLSEAGQPEKAVAEYEAALRKEPANADIQELLADEQAKLARYGDAAATYRRELELNPHSPIALYNLGRIDVEHGRPAEGVAELRRAAKENAGPAPTMYYLGFGLIQLDQNEEAARALETSLASGPSPFIEQSALFQLARTYSRLGKASEAAKAVARLQALKAAAVPGSLASDDLAPNQASPPPMPPEQL